MFFNGKPQKEHTMKIRVKKTTQAVTCVCAGACLLTGCAALMAPPQPATLSMTSKPIIDKSVLAPKMGDKAYSKIMVIPPSGTIRGEYSPILATFERGLLKHGVTVVTPAVTGKVATNNTPELGKDGQVVGLSDLERALIMAETTGAEAILQIGAYEWAEGVAPTRFFVIQRGDKREAPVFNEVAEDVYMANPLENRIQYASNKLVFTGRLIDVSGEVVATLNMALPTNYVLPRDYHAKFAQELTGWQMSEQNYPYFSEYWIAKTQASAGEQIVEAVVKILVTKK